MNGPSATRMTSAASASPCGTPHITASVMPRHRRAFMAGSLPVISTQAQTRSIASGVVERDPWRNLAIGPLLQLDDSGSHDCEHHQGCKNLLGLHHLSGRDQEITHAAL